MISHDFNIDERVSILEKQLALLKEEQSFLSNQIHSDERQKFIDLNRLFTLSLDILSKEEYLLKLKESIKRDALSIEKSWKELDVNKLLTHIQDIKVDERTLNKLEYLKKEMLYFLSLKNKEAVVFYSDAIINIFKKHNYDFR